MLIRFAALAVGAECWHTMCNETNGLGVEEYEQEHGMNRDVQQLQPGTNVYGSDNEKVGDLAEVGANYLLVRKGFLFVKDRYIPFSAISRVDTDGVYLNVTKDQIDSQSWEQAPAHDSTTFAGTMSTAATDTSNYATDTTSTANANSTHTHTTSAPTSSEAKVPIIEEELRVGKREVDSGGVRVNTRVEEVPVQEQVTVREETVDVHRRPVNREVTSADVANLQEGSFEVRERDEEVVVDKQARVVEEVHIKKNVEDRTETVQDTVRRTDVDVQQVGGQTRTTDYSDTSGTGTTPRTGSEEGIVERTLGNANNVIERNTGLDTDRSGAAGDRDPGNNY